MMLEPAVSGAVRVTVDGVEERSTGSSTHGAPAPGHVSGTGPIVPGVADIEPPVGAVVVGVRVIVELTAEWLVPVHRRSNAIWTWWVEPGATVPRLIRPWSPATTTSASAETESATAIPDATRDSATAPVRMPAIRWCIDVSLQPWDPYDPEVRWSRRCGRDQRVRYGEVVPNGAWRRPPSVPVHARTGVAVEGP